MDATFGFELGVYGEDGFNLKEVAEALNGGANRRELEDIIEAGLASAVGAETPRCRGTEQSRWGCNRASPAAAQERAEAEPRPLRPPPWRDKLQALACMRGSRNS